MKSIDFYNLTRTMLDTLAKERGVRNIARYYDLTDYSKGSFLLSYSGKSQIFAQMAFHAQNATMISNIVNFERNLIFLDKTLCGFDPAAFLQKYPIDKREDSVLRLVEDLRYSEATDEGLRWRTDKNKTEKKDSLIKRYSNTLIESAEFVNSFKDEKAFLDDLLDHYTNKDYKSLIKYFRSRVTVGFSVALTCDFLKEFDKHFCDLPKPDIHIKDTLCSLYGLEQNYYSGEKKEYECIATMQTITREINESLDSKQKITVYQLDRMIWLICSGNFFLDARLNKEKYLEAVKG